MIICACLDACVLVPALIRDVLLQIADLHVFEPIWSTRIQVEYEKAIRDIHNRHGVASAETEQYLSGIATAMNDTFPFARQELASHPLAVDPTNFPDPYDIHVIEAAMIGNAAVIVTFNLRDFPRELLPSGLMALHPDVFLMDFAKNERTARKLLRAIRTISKRSGRKGPAWTERQILDQLHQLGLKQFADWASTRVND